MPQLNAELEKDIQSLSIKTLCTTTRDDKINVIFPAAGPLNSIAAKFYTMTFEYPSSTFVKSWKSNLQKLVTITSDVRFNHIADNVWTPSLRLCCSRVNSCKDMSIKLSTLDHRFKPLESKGKLEQELTNLSLGSAICMGVDEGTTEWIQSTCAHMREYWMLCTCREAAAQLLELKNAIPLEGNFRDVDILSTGVRLSMSPM